MKVGVERHVMKGDQASQQPCIRANGMMGCYMSMQNIFQFNMALKHLFNKYVTMP